jgi:hypothetical protein
MSKIWSLSAWVYTATALSPVYWTCREVPTKSSVKARITFLKNTESLSEKVCFVIEPLFKGSLLIAHFSICGPIIPNPGISTAFA